MKVSWPNVRVALKDLASDLLLACGTASIAFGVYQIHEPSGFIALGVLAGGWGYLIGRS